jgi:hypothetical protein
MLIDAQVLSLALWKFVFSVSMPEKNFFKSPTTNDLEVTKALDYPPHAAF